MNKKGITLIELLAVITIMGLILLIVIPNVASLLEKATVPQHKQLVTILENAAKAYVEHYDSSGLYNVGDVKDITLNDLSEVKLIKLPIINPITDEEVPPDSVIRVKKVDVNKYKYELPL
ncbi:MAG: type II secretion system protein [Bacilli bacterium]|jgi:prepilin-type N-terminal cleavage/methylation domain-containing protein